MATGKYTNTANLERRFGRRNIEKWSNLDNDDAVAAEASVQAAIDDYEAELEDKFRGGKYVVPFSPASNRTIQRLATEGSGLRLYMNRGFDDDPDEDEPVAGMMSSLLRRLDKEIPAYTGGIRQLPLAKSETGPTAPTVILPGGRRR